VNNSLPSENTSSSPSSKKVEGENFGNQPANFQIAFNPVANVQVPQVNQGITFQTGFPQQTGVTVPQNNSFSFPGGQVEGQNSSSGSS
jgi:hypothetical protein